MFQLGPIGRLPQRSRHHLSGARRRWSWGAVAALSLGLSGCLISPKQEPPDAEPTLDLDSTEIETIFFGALDLRGAPGAANPPGATIRAYPLDSGSPVREATVATDGSFYLQGVALEGEEVRLQVLTDNDRTAPVDILFEASWGSPLVAERPLGSCFVLSPAPELDLGVRQDVRVRNDCTHEITIAAPTARRELPELELGSNQSWPATLATGEELVVTATVADVASFEAEVIFITATAPVLDRRPITVQPP